MWKRYLIPYGEFMKVGWRKKMIVKKHVIITAHKAESAMKDFRKNHPGKCPEGIYIEYKKRGD